MTKEQVLEEALTKIADANNKEDPKKIARRALGLTTNHNLSSPK